MGIRGLLKYVSSQVENNIPTEFIPTGSTLIVDGNGWMFHLVSEYKILWRREYGGTYQAFDDFVRDEAKRLKEDFGFNVVFYFDGPISRMKCKTMDERLKKDEDSWATLLKLCETGVSPSAYNDLPLPPLYTDQLGVTLKDLCFEVVRCEEEADQEIAKACLAKNKNIGSGDGSLSFCYGNDSDFLLMKDCPYIKFGELKPCTILTPGKAPSNGSAGHAPRGAVARVWRRSDLSAQLGMSEEQFIEFAILIGNDFTGVYPRSNFDIHPEALASNKPSQGSTYEPLTDSPLAKQSPNFDTSFDTPENPNSYSIEEINHIHEWILSKDTKFKLTSTSNLDLQQGIEFSRDMYELNDLSKYPRDPSHKRLMSLSSDQIQSIHKFIDTLVSSSPSPSKLSALMTHNLKFSSNKQQQPYMAAGTGTGTGLDIGRLGIEYLEHMRSLSLETEKKHRHKYDLYEIPDDGLSTLHQLHDILHTRKEAAAAVVAQERSISAPASLSPSGGTDKGRSQMRSSSYLEGVDSLGVPSWEDVVFALQYQLICKEIHRYISKHRTQTGSPTTTPSKSPNKSRDRGGDIADGHVDDEELDAVMVSLDAKYIYDGIVFHNLRYERRWKTEENQSPSQKSRSGGVAKKPSFPTLSDEDDAELSASDTEEQESVNTPKLPPKEDVVDTSKLPIDAFREEILRRIHSDRVIVIHGETGCGKSSRVPAMIMEDAMARNAPCRMMVSQPRRIAASSLMKRLRKTLGNMVGLRMGHGVKDETDATRIFFVTTGYLVRLLAHRPGSFLKHTHLIIDEVHERSVDGDVLCLLARKLLQTHPTIKLILMSATIHTELYRNYFSNQNQYYGNLDCLSVGARRFPVEIKYAEDIANTKKLAQGYARGSLDKIIKLTSNCRGGGSDSVPDSLGKEQYGVVVSIIKQVVQKGTGVLVFVSGMLDISELTERFEGLSEYRVFAIHSDIPYEDQEAAFDPVGPDEIKVVIATNAAESSITLPDVDTVICLGTHKAMRYYEKTHSIRLINTWISKASATQRAGRTGRVRPGSVYRLYSKRLSDSFDEHEDAEVHRRPLQDVILRLRAMLEDAEDFEGVVPILENLIEPPDMNNVQKSFEFLFEANMISSDNDEGVLTELGKFAGNLPIDIQYSRLIAYGVALGLRYEAIVIAAALSLPKTPFLSSSPLTFSDPDQYTCVASKIFLGNLLLDAGLYSQPIMMLCMFIRWREFENDYNNNNSKRFAWASRYGVGFKSMKLFESTARHLAERVDQASNYYLLDLGDEDTPSKQSGKSPGDSGVKSGLRHLKYPSVANVNLLRLLLVWSCDGNVFRMKPVKFKSEADKFAVTIPNSPLTNQHIEPLFPKAIPWTLKNEGSRMYSAKLSPYQHSVSRLEMFNELIRVAVTVSAPVIWIHFKSSKSEKEKLNVSNDSSNKGRKKKGKGHDSEELEEGEIQEDFELDLELEGWGDNQQNSNIQSSDKEDAGLTIIGIRIDSKEQHWPGVSNIFSSDRLEYCGLLGEDESHRQSGEGADPVASLYECYLCIEPSKREVKLLDNMHAVLPACLRMSASDNLNSPVVLMAYNCVPPSNQLEQLFFGCMSDSCSDPSHNHIPESRVIMQQIHASNQQLIFPSTDEPFHLLPDSIEDPYSGKMVHTARNPVVKDISPGLRLLNFYQLGYFKDRAMKFWSTPTPVEHVKKHHEYLDRANARQPRSPTIPGSSTVAKGKPGYAKASAPPEEPDDGKLVLKLSIAQPTWLCLRSLILGNVDVGTELPKSFMPLNSIQSVAVPVSDNKSEDFYAIAQSTMLIGEEGRSMRSEWLTILPPGSLWIKLALECKGDLTDGLSKKSEELNEDQLLKSLRISNMLEDLKNNVVCEHPILRELVLRLFEPWVGEDESYDSPWGTNNTYGINPVEATKAVTPARRPGPKSVGRNLDREMVATQRVSSSPTFPGANLTKEVMVDPEIENGFKCPSCEERFRNDGKEFKKHLTSHNMSKKQVKSASEGMQSWRKRMEESRKGSTKALAVGNSSKLYGKPAPMPSTIPSNSMNTPVSRPVKGASKPDPPPQSVSTVAPLSFECPMCSLTFTKLMKFTSHLGSSHMGISATEKQQLKSRFESWKIQRNVIKKEVREKGDNSLPQSSIPLKQQQHVQYSQEEKRENELIAGFSKFSLQRDVVVSTGLARVRGLFDSEGEEDEDELDGEDDEVWEDVNDFELVTKDQSNGSSKTGEMACFLCPVCGKMFPALNRMDAHISALHTQGASSNAMMKQRLSNSSSEKSKGSNQKIVAPVDGQADQLVLLTASEKKRVKAKFVCPTCTKQFGTRAACAAHVEAKQHGVVTDISVKTVS